MSNQDFFVKMAPYAATAAAALNIDEGVILAQWALETGYGTSDLCKRSNNYAGITYGGGPYGDKEPDTSYMHYVSIDQFVLDYIRVMKLSFYDGVRAAGTVSAQIKALGDSPWAESHYAYTAGEAPSADAVGVHGRIVNDIYYAGNLGQYAGHPRSDGGAPVPQGDPQTLKMAAIGVAAVAFFALLASNNSN